MSRGPRTGLILAAGLVVMLVLLVGAVVALAATGVSGWRAVPSAWPSWTNAAALAAIASSVILFGLISARLVILLRHVAAPSPRDDPAPHGLPKESPSGLPARFGRMGGAEFENEMAELFGSLGYSVERAPASGGTPGVDLLLKKGNRKIAVQLKRWTAPVGHRAVQAVFTGRIHHAADEAWLLTTSRFTPRAAKLARTTGVRLIDGVELSSWLDEPNNGG
jgi:hypothetical protein